MGGGAQRRFLRRERIFERRERAFGGTFLPPMYTSWLAVFVKRTLTNKEGVVKSWEWIWVMERARSSFWGVERGIMCSTSYRGIVGGC